jgi:biotin-(acetyl-CoA carboxylase) ligase
MRDEWRGYHALQGLAIDVKEAGRADYAAIVQDVAADGSLVVRVGSETLSLNSAEISVRAHAASTTNAEEADS